MYSVDAAATIALPSTSPMFALMPSTPAETFQRGLMYQSTDAPISGSGTVVDVDVLRVPVS